ncbi:hypothetical protein AVEN_160752-1 [Araneus ventricosus]|uniref:Uncharacterized protein n=1 Tax=Araneus ventricosus TaxID=182803 RepID=A0A4Y2GEU7_ARAVE|nr:hypothetical protein AVEN_160752-1 [Araneus ventricosus]
MGACDDLPSKPERFHWRSRVLARLELVTQLCRASVNNAIKEHGIIRRVTPAAFGVTASCVCSPLLNADQRLTARLSRAVDKTPRRDSHSKTISVDQHALTRDPSTLLI